MLILVASVQDVRTQPDSRQQFTIGVDLVDGVQHRLHPLDALVRFDRAAVPALRQTVLVYGEQAAQHQISLDLKSVVFLFGIFESSFAFKKYARFQSFYSSAEFSLKLKHVTCLSCLL